MARKLNPDGRRIRAIIISAPFLVASSILLYKRLVLGEEQRRLPGSSRSALPVPGDGGPEGMPQDVLKRIKEAEDESRRR
ncbi:uncharacterized protein JCM10292_000266 [Rhodotorula paludigena]|uniref:uncharacterized protein n=1 Tax=Rhodotorula paludigena TaxID=86838 RepID=UPI00317045FC